MQDDIQKELFSSHRLQSYTSTKEHEENLRLISTISHKIGLLEIIIRNKIDILMTEKNEDWFKKLPDYKKYKDDLEKLDRHQFISSQNLGFWLKIADCYKIHNAIFGIAFLDNLDFKKYFEKNKNRFSRKSNFRDYHKAKVILLLLKLIRNRAFHFENLYKIAENGYPRLNVKVSNKHNKNIYMAIHPSKIIEFLNNLLKSFDKDLMYYAESGGKGSA